VIALSPSNIDAYVNLGKVYSMMGEADKARGCLRRAYQMCGFISNSRAAEIKELLGGLPPENVSKRYYGMALARVNSKKYNEAIFYYKMSLSRGAAEEGVYTGYAYRDLGKIYILQRRFVGGGIVRRDAKTFQNLLYQRGLAHLAWTGQDLHETTGLLQTLEEAIQVE